ncbi:MAG: CARDB domain-containing protein [Nitrosospira sp.]
MADLTARSLVVSPEYPVPGERTQVRLEIHNRGAEPASRVEVAFFANGQPLDTRYVSVPAQSVETVTLTWTPASIGLQAVSAIVDPRQVFAERDRLDNAIAVEVVVADRPPAAADFAVSALETVTAAERPGVLQVVVRNDGKVRGSAPLLVRRDGTPVFAVLVGPIEPGQAVTVEIPWSADESGRMSAEINPRFARSEPRADNNILDERDARLPIDLRVAELAFQTAHLEVGQRRRVAVTFQIINAGQRAITQSFRTRIEPGVMDPDGERPFYVTTTGMPAGSVIHVSHMIESAPGDFTLTVTVDVDKAIEESNEENNQATKHFSNPAPDIDRWVSIGPRRITGSSAHGYGWNDAVGRLSAIAIHPNSPNTMYVGAQTGGAWKTTDGGENWSPVAESATVRVAALGLAPDKPSRVYLVTPGDGVFRSNDEGTSWSQISTQNLDGVVHGGVLLINPGNTIDLLVASNQGVYRSIDGGVTWQLTLSGGAATGLVRLPSNSRTVFAAIGHATDANIAGIYRSFDSGGTWRPVEGCPGGTLPAGDANTTIRLAVSGSQVFASYRRSDPLTFTLFRTTGIGCSIGGLTDSSWEAGWTPTGTVAGRAIPAVLWSGLWADPTNTNNLYLGGTFFWRSTNNGSSFTVTSGQGGSGAAHVDHHGVATDPQSANVIYSLNDGGIYRSASRGAGGTWKFIGDGIYNVEFYDHVSAPTKSNLVIGGTQDNGTIKATAGDSAVWRMILGGDGATVDFDWTDPKIMYAMNQYASSIARSSNSGDSFSGAASGLPAGSTCFNLHFQVHPRTPATLLASCMGLWRSVDSGASWSTIFTPPAGAITRTTVDGPADVYYAGSTFGAIFQGPTGAGWTSAFSHPAALAVTDIEVDEDNRAIIYASFGGTNFGRVFRLVRTPTFPPTFVATNITSDLPVGRAVRTIAVDRNRRFTVYAGTDRGVFRGRSIDGGMNWFWVPYANGLPGADVRDLEVHPGTGVMRAATLGRSAFEVNTDHPIGSILVAAGQLTFLRVHDVGTGFGPPIDPLDAEVVVKIDSEPLKAFGFQLRTDANEEARRRMLDVLRDAFRSDQPVRIEYFKTGLRHGVIFRVVKMP